MAKRGRPKKAVAELPPQIDIKSTTPIEIAGFIEGFLGKEQNSVTVQTIMGAPLCMVKIDSIRYEQLTALVKEVDENYKAEMIAIIPSAVEPNKIGLVFTY